MHELSIALEVCRLAESYASPQPARDIVEVGLEVGDDSGFELANLEFCLEALLSHEPFGRAHPRVLRVPGDVLRITYLEVDDDGAPNRSP
jgi:Zn finger protein HypA/HybF involved in hydrogenase expression